MRRAIELSRLGFPAPNPHVGCVIAQGRAIVGEGFHDHAGGPHAEAVALEAAGMHSSGASVYVTQEPCNHHGRTPPCSEALIAAKVRRVIFAIPDPNPKGTGGRERLREAGIEVAEGLLAHEARQANIMWLTAFEKKRPYVVLKSAASIDGRITTAGGESKWITGPEARREGQRLRAHCGAVLVGRATVQLDQPQLTVREVEVVNQPVKIILDPWRKLAPANPILQENALRVVNGEPKAGEIRGELRSGKFHLAPILAALFERGITGVLVEGGSKTLSSFVEQNQFDQIELFISGKMLGNGKPWLETNFTGSLASRPELYFSSIRALGGDIQVSLLPKSPA